MKGTFIIAIRFHETAVERVFPDGQHNPLAAAADNRRHHQRQIPQLCQRFGAATLDGTAVFFQYCAFAGDGCLRDEQVSDGGQPHIRWHTVTGGKQHDIPHHQLFGGNLLHLSPPSDSDAFPYQLIQLLLRAFRSHFLCQPNNATDQNHRKDDDGGGRIPCEIGRENDIRHQRNHAENEEDDIEWIDKRTAQPPHYRVVVPASETVRTMFLPHPFDLSA